MSKKLYFDMYKIERYSQRFKGLFDNIQIEKVFNYLQSSHQVDQMINASIDHRPAMEGIILGLEEEFPLSSSYDLASNMRHRQITGSMIRFILGHYMYFPSKTKVMACGSYVRSAIVYKYSE